MFKRSLMKRSNYIDRVYIMVWITVVVKLAPIVKYNKNFMAWISGLNLELFLLLCTIKLSSQLCVCMSALKHVWTSGLVCASLSFSLTLSGFMSVSLAHTYRHVDTQTHASRCTHIHIYTLTQTDTHIDTHTYTHERKRDR